VKFFINLYDNLNELKKALFAFASTPSFYLYAIININGNKMDKKLVLLFSRRKDESA
jgi:hypothetical protein